MVGVGKMGRRHARVFSELTSDFELVGVMDISKDDASAVARQVKSCLMANEAAAIDHGELVVLATPIDDHAAIGARILGAGRHLLVEKPICARPEEALALVAMAQCAGLEIFVGHSERYNPVIRALVARIAPDDVRSVDLCRVGPRAGTWSTDHGVILNLAIHDLDLMAHLTQSPVDVKSAIGRLAPTGGEDRALLVVDTASGVAGRIYVDRVSAARCRTIEVKTDDCVFHGNLLRPRLTCTWPATGEVRELPLEMVEPLAAQAADVARALDGVPNLPVARGIDGARALVLAERASRRIREALSGTRGAPGHDSFAGAGAEKL